MLNDPSVEGGVDRTRRESGSQWERSTLKTITEYCVVARPASTRRPDTSVGRSVNVITTPSRSPPGRDSKRPSETSRPLRSADFTSSVSRVRRQRRPQRVERRRETGEAKAASRIDDSARRGDSAQWRPGRRERSCSDLRSGGGASVERSRMIVPESVAPAAEAVPGRFDPRRRQ